MSVKIKINWDNENVVSESVRIYRADSIFTPTSLPPLLTEIVGDVYEYEDTAVIEGNTYFYMLSATLGEQEVFTECFEVKTYEDPFGYWMVNLASYGALANNYASYDPKTSPLPVNFEKTIDFAHANVDRRPAATAGFTSSQKTTVIPKSPVGFKFRFIGFMGYGTSCENPTTIRFEKSDGTLVFALQSYRVSSATQGLRYSFDGSSWTDLPRTGSSGVQIAGDLSITETGVSFVNSRSSQYVNSFSISINLSQVTKLTVTSRATCSTYSGGSAAYLYLNCIKQLS